MTYPGSSPRINPTFAGRESFQGASCLEGPFHQRLDSSGDRVGVQASLGGTSGPSQGFSPSWQVPVFSRGLSGFGPRNCLPSVEGSSGGNQLTVPWSWFLRPPFLCSEENGWLPSGPGFVPPQSVPSEDAFSHGNSFLNSFSHSARRLGNIHRSQGRIFSRLDSSQVQKMASVRLERQDFSVPCTPIWSVAGSLGVYPDHSRSLYSSSLQRHQTFSFSGRLAHSGRKSGTEQSAFNGIGQPCQGSRFHSQPEEVCFDPVSKFHLPGDGFRFSKHDSSSNPRENRPLQGSPFLSSVSFSDNSSHTGLLSRSDRVSSSSGSVGQRPQEGVAAPVSQALVSIPSVLGHCDSSRSMVSLGHSSMDSGFMTSSRCTNISPSMGSGTFHRCIPDRMGRSCGRAHSLRPVACGVQRPTYQHAGNDGCFPSCSVLCPVSTGQISSPLHRQHDSLLLCEQRGGGHTQYPCLEKQSLFCFFVRTCTSL